MATSSWPSPLTSRTAREAPEVGTQLGTRQVAQLKQALTSQENNLEKKERTNGQTMLCRELSQYPLKFAKVLVLLICF